jgi:hypothetical protein
MCEPLETFAEATLALCSCDRNLTGRVTYSLSLLAELQRPVRSLDAKELVEEFLRVWAKNHNPNDKNNRRNRYVYFYGYEQRADAIPLTRSKQERNLVELAEWVARIRQLPLEDLDEELIAAAFTSAHSIAEVYRLETIEEVFGSMHDLEPEILAQLVQKMRTNLVGVWRQPNTQKENKTKRRQRDIQGEILRGYQVARSVTEQALADHPESWQLMLARASVMHDENNFRQELAQDSKFSGKRQEAFREFERAAEMYAAQVEDLLEEEESTEVFETWFYASLGACDLGAVDERKQAVAAQIERIRGVLESLPDERAEHHMDMFSNTLNWSSSTEIRGSVEDLRICFIGTTRAIAR